LSKAGHEKVPQCLQTACRISSLPFVHVVKAGQAIRLEDHTEIPLRKLKFIEHVSLDGEP
jgi:hypothetical protein